MSSVLKVILYILVLTVLGSFLFVFPKKIDQGSSIVVPSISTPQPFLFQEMTIPYLMQKEYESSLDNLSVYQNKEDYTSYLTSYLSDGLRVNGLLTIPKGDGPFPAIVFIHGYIAPTIYQTTEKYTDYVDYLARNGFVVFKIDLRGHGASEGVASGAYYSGDYIVDTLNAYAALQAADFVNPAKVGLWGHSMAGNVVLRSVAAKKDIPAVVIWAGAGYTYTDLLSYRLMDASYRPPSLNTERRRQRDLLNSSYGSFDANSWFWKQVPATNYLDGLRTSIQVHHAVNDDVVNIEYSRNLMRVLDGTSLPHELFEYLTGGHNLTGSSFSQAMQRTVEFFKKNL